MALTRLRNDTGVSMSETFSSLSRYFPFYLETARFDFINFLSIEYILASKESRLNAHSIVRLKNLQT